MPHRDARLTVHARLLIVERDRAGWPQARIAEQLGVSRGTVKKWIDRGHGASAVVFFSASFCW